MQMSIGRVLSHTHAGASNLAQSSSARPANLRVLNSRFAGVRLQGTVTNGTRVQAFFNFGKLRADSEDAGRL